MPALLPDYHIHTYLCKHAAGMPEAYKAAAAAAHIPEIGIADHVPAPDGYDRQHRMDLAGFPVYRELVGAIQNDQPPPVLFGIEADYYPAGVDFLRAWLPQQPFDYVIGSVHYIGDWAFDAPEQSQRWQEVGVEDAWRQYFSLLEKLALTRLFDIVGHLDLPKKFGQQPDWPAVEAMANPALDAICAAGMAIEINTGGLRKPVREIYPSLNLLKMARARNIPICFGSDAHAPDEVAYAFDAALRLARAAGYTTAVRFCRRRQASYPLPEL